MISIAQGLKMKDGQECNSSRDMSASGDITIPQFVTGPLPFEHEYHLWQCITRTLLAGTFRSHAFRIPDEEYGRALDCIVKACCDVIVTVADEPAAAALQEMIFLGRRQVEPQPDWWFIGGRM
jgi:hypothetical protein